MHLSEEIARTLIDLNPYPDQHIIDPNMAERQFHVILKGFNYLIQPGNDFLYIADEVGLGKTYISLGIASLLRLYSDHPESYVDTILVPKRNLQFKWHKEIRNFITHNYLQTDNRVKSVLDMPVGRLDDNSIKEEFISFPKEQPKYVIYRNSTFSVGSAADELDLEWARKLESKLPMEQQVLFSKIVRRFRRKDQHILIKRAYAYLLNYTCPEIDLLIVDEAHNFKHGIGNSVSIRNQLSGRYFGAINDDPDLFEAFPELEEYSQPKVRKLLFLSATPINRSLAEIKNQLDCFLPVHRFSTIEEHLLESEINNSLNEFLIRGVMNLKWNNKVYSRNGYRHEHRKGNVEMSETADFQRIKDESTALFLSLVQYKTIRELKFKSNNQFEMGMLAGFESFARAASSYEEETLSSRNEKEAKDDGVIRDLVDDYYQQFDAYPPHPKQESLVEELFSLMQQQKKALVFVRRIASVREIERKLFKKYSDFLIEKVKKIGAKFHSPAVKRLLENYKDEHIEEQINRVIGLIAERTLPELKGELLWQPEPNSSQEELITTQLTEIYRSMASLPELDQFRDEVRDHARLKIVRSDLRELAILLLRRIWRGEISLADENGEEDDDENTITEHLDQEEKAPYFFQKFFYKDGKKFKDRSYTKDWYELNLLLFNDKYHLFDINQSVLQTAPEFRSKSNEYNRFRTYSKMTIKAIRSNSSTHAIVHDDYRTNTFMTTLLLDLCKDEFANWVNTFRSKQSHDGSNLKILDDLEYLIEIIKSIFRSGSGLLPTFIAEAVPVKKEQAKDGFIQSMQSLLEGEFEFVLKEVKQIITDYQKLVSRNFDDLEKIRYSLIQQLPVCGVSGQHKRDVRKTATQFRMPGYPFVLIATDILKEGEDLHAYCKNVYHYGIAWNPSDMEQRTGRVDRIDSLAYRELRRVESSSLGQIPFKAKLQVFYPYLADTIEVNQMLHLFKGMDQFIEIFYNNLSQKPDQTSKAMADEIVLDIPEQPVGLLVSKYDFDTFCSSMNGNDAELNVSQLLLGLSKDELMFKMEEIFEQLNGWEYFIEPFFDRSRLIIKADVNLDGRRGPFSLYCTHNHLPGSFDIYMESVIGRVHILGRACVKAKMLNLLEENIIRENLGFTLKESNSLVFLTLRVEFGESTLGILHKLERLVRITDEMEYNLTGEDEKIDRS